MSGIELRTSNSWLNRSTKLSRTTSEVISLTEKSRCTKLCVLKLRLKALRKNISKFSPCNTYLGRYVESISFSLKIWQSICFKNPLHLERYSIFKLIDHWIVKEQGGLEKLINRMMIRCRQNENPENCSPKFIFSLLRRSPKCRFQNFIGRHCRQKSAAFNVILNVAFKWRLTILIVNV